jgi:hypothetical protein
MPSTSTATTDVPIPSHNLRKRCSRCLLITPDL